MKSKPTLYSDTNILSLLHYRGGHVMALAKHRKTKDWWDLERKYFSLVSSRHTEEELSRGVYAAQFSAVAEVRRMRYLPPATAVDACAEVYLKERIVPHDQIGDAIQLAFATLYRIDYLLTWNYAHLANPHIQRNLETINTRNGWRSPLLVSPETIPWATMGQEIRRKNGP